MNRIVMWDLADFGETPTPMGYIDQGSFTPQPEVFQPKTLKTSSSMEAILFVADTNQVLVLDISDIRNNNTAILSTISSKATQTDDQWYDLAISDEVLFIFSDTANAIEEWDMAVITTPVKMRDYPVYDKDLNVNPGTYDYDAYNDLFFMTSNNTDDMGGNDDGAPPPQQPGGGGFPPLPPAPSQFPFTQPTPHTQFLPLPDPPLQFLYPSPGEPQVIPLPSQEYADPDLPLIPLKPKELPAPILHSRDGTRSPRGPAALPKVPDEDMDDDLAEPTIGGVPVSHPPKPKPDPDEEPPRIPPRPYRERSRSQDDQ